MATQNTNFVPYNVESKSKSDVDQEPKMIEKYVSCADPNCYQTLHNEIEKQDERANCKLYSILLLILASIITIVILIAPSDWTPV